MEYTDKLAVTDSTDLGNGTKVTEFTDELAGRSVMTGEDGRMPAFFGLAKANGGVYAENTTGQSPADMMRAADTDFTVSFLEQPGGDVIDGDGVEHVAWGHMRGTYATFPPTAEGIRRPRRAFGMVKSKYQITQPAQLADFGQAFLDEAGANCVAAGAYGRPLGSRIYLAFKLPEGLLVGGQDAYDLCLTLLTSYDGSTSNIAVIAPIRLACTNQIPSTFGSTATRFLFKHTGDMRIKLEEARTALKVTDTWTERYNAWCERALQKPLAGGDVTEFVKKLLPTPKVKTDRAADNWEFRRRSAANVILRGVNNEFGRGTAYAAYQGMVEYLQHIAPAESAVRRYTRIMDGGDNDKTLQKAVTLLNV